MSLRTRSIRFSIISTDLSGMVSPGWTRWLSTYLGADDNPLNRAMGRKVLIAAVRRVRMPGTKFDQMWSLKDRKTAARAVPSKSSQATFSVTRRLSASTARGAGTLSGVWLYEISELAGLSKSDAEE